MKTRTILSALGASMALLGCNAGMAPEPMSREEARDALSKMSPQEQIKYYESGPMPAEQKKQKIAEIEAKYGIKAETTGAPKVGQ